MEGMKRRWLVRLRREEGGRVTEERGEEKRQKGERVFGKPEGRRKESHRGTGRIGRDRRKRRWLEDKTGEGGRVTEERGEEKSQKGERMVGKQEGRRKESHCEELDGSNGRKEERRVGRKGRRVKRHKRRLDKKRVGVKSWDREEEEEGRRARGECLRVMYRGEMGRRIMSEKREKSRKRRV